MTQPLAQPVPLLTFALAAPATDPATNTPVTNVEVRDYHIRPIADPNLPQFPNGYVRIFYGVVTDPRTFDVFVALSPAQQTTFQNAAKTAIQNKTGIALV